LSPKRTFNQVPAKTALVLTGSAVALAAYLGASSSGAGHDGRGARQTGLAAALTASHQAPAAGTLTSGAATTGAATTGAATTGTLTASTAGGPGTVLQSGTTSGTGSASTASATSGSAPIALATYGTARKHPQPRRPHPKRHPKRHPKHHQKHHPRHHPKHHAVKHHHATKHRARRHRGRLHGNPWQIAGSLMPAYHWTSWQFHYLNLLWMRESGWNRFAYNHSSGAYGIPQAVPGDKMAAAGPDWRTSARTQIIWGMGYIRSRYGDPWNAWQHELRYGWY
jgi:hypothetical protein